MKNSRVKSKFKGLFSEKRVFYLFVRKKYVLNTRMTQF